jgi:deoxyribodipyrimidine photo-lyase
LSYDTALVWFRRDLRIHDHAALHAALSASRRVYCAFVFDRDILDVLPKADRRVEFIWHSVRELDGVIRQHGGGLIVLHGKAIDEIPALAQRLKVNAVFTNRDYEPAAVARDAAVKSALAAAGIVFEARKDQVIFEQDEVLTQSDRPFSVFTPYKNAWLKKLNGFYLQAYPTEKYFDRLVVPPEALLPALPSLADLGFAKTNLLELGIAPGMSGAEKLFKDFKKRIENYHERRDFPALKGPSYLSVHLRFGTISIRALASSAWHDASRGAAVWLSELIWRDFYFMILHHHPQVVGHAFRPEYDALKFENDPEKFAAWCEARTGYPLVDAAMRQINQTGYMHNRLRMVTASFLVKDLHIDWRWGEQYFAEHLIDFDLAANNGGWQWAASTGCDAQSEKFDADGKFIRRYLPELKGCNGKFIHGPWQMTPEQQQKAGSVIGRDYPQPVVDHDVARKATLAMYQKFRKAEF